MPEKPLLEIKNVHLKYGNNHVLRGIDCEINSGEIYALIGEHGAGKSSVGQIISGITPALHGEIYFHGKRMNPFTFEKAIANNILCVTQNNFGFGNLTVAENIFMKSKTKRRRIFNASIQSKMTLEYFYKLGIKLDPDTVMNDLNLSDKVFVNILKQIHEKPELLILDESLEKLSSDNLEIIIPLLFELINNGSSILLITHRIDDVFKWAKNLIILREGKIVFKGTLENIDKISLIRLAYMQLTKEDLIGYSDENFSDFLKYNEAILTRLPLHLFIVDSKFHVRLMNNKAKSLLRPSSKLTGDWSINEVFADQPDFLKLITRELNEQKETTTDNFNYNISGKTINFNIKIVPIFELNRYIGSIITLEDITKQEQLRSQIILSENLSAVGMLAAGVAHEINNPLEIINYSLQDLKYRDTNNSFTQELESLEEEMKTIASIVKNLVVFSDNNTKTSNKFCIYELIKDIVRLIKFKAKENKINISLTFLEGNIFVLANRTEIRQALLNIIKNSIEAMVNGGDITIDLKTTSNNFVEVIFSDEGGGICLDNPNDIFLPFYSTKNDDSKNTGLGLPISYNLVKKNSGELTFKNHSPIGCEFKMTLPLFFEP